jgi:2-methylcitrate dehydratase PrpD
MLQTDATVNTLRTLTLANVAAAGGDLGRAGTLIQELPLDGSRSPGDAAFIAALRLHARTQDDFHPSGRVHVGAATLAAALALSDRVGTRTLECLAAGYEVMCILGATYAPEAQARGFRPTSVFAPFGAAATAAVALELDFAGRANAIALAASMSCGTNQAWIAGSDEWLLELGLSARAGVEAALLTEAGVRAAPDAIEGAAGWAKAYCGDEGSAALVARLAGADSLINEVAVKPYPVSGIAQVPTHLACQIHGELKGAVPDHICVRMSTAEASYPGSTNRGPFRSRSDALMSVAFCVACGVTSGRVTLATTEAARHAELTNVLDRIRLEADDSLEDTQGALRAEMNGRVLEFTLDGGEIFHPLWQSIASDPEALAVRCEAPPALVQSVSCELAGDAPDCRAIARHLATWRSHEDGRLQ